MKGVLRWVLVVTVLVGGWVLLKRTALAPNPIPVRVEPVARGTAEESVTNSKAGKLQTRLRSGLSVEIPGTVAEILHREGDRVAAGDLLVRLKDGEVRAEVEAADAAVAAARARLEAARKDEDRARLHFEERSRNRDRVERIGREAPQRISEAELDRARTEAALAEADLHRTGAAAGVAEAEWVLAEAERTLAGTRLGKHEVRAPFDGVITELFTEIGEWAVPGSPVLDLLDPDALYITAEIDEVDLGRGVVDGLDVRITLDPYRGRTFPGRVTRIAPYVSDVEEQNRTFEIEVEFIEMPDDVPLRPGISTDVEVILRSRPDVLRVPTYAVIEGGWVLVAENGRAVRREVGTGLRNWDFVEITEGLSEGDPVIVSLDREEVREGAAITIEAGNDGS